jgi:hypothetical protein
LSLRVEQRDFSDLLGVGRRAGDERQGEVGTSGLVWRGRGAMGAAEARRGREEGGRRQLQTGRDDLSCVCWGVSGGRDKIAQMLLTVTDPGKILGGAEL